MKATGALVVIAVLSCAIVRDAQREHDALWHDHRAANGGATARSLELWLEAVDRFLS